MRHLNHNPCEIRYTAHKQSGAVNPFVCTLAVVAVLCIILGVAA